MSGIFKSIMSIIDMMKDGKVQKVEVPGLLRAIGNIFVCIADMIEGETSGK